jgi:hypothetical protein
MLYTIIAPTNPQKYIEIILYKQKRPICFGQPCGHLQEGKTQR